MLEEMSKKYEKSKYQIMLNWNLCRGVCVIPKSERLENQKANIACTEFRMSEEDVVRITKACDRY